MFTIKQATLDDIPIINTIIREANQDVAERFGLTPENAPKHPSNCAEDWIASAFEKGITYYLLEDDQTPRGCVALEQPNPDVCYLERLAVLPAFRRRGFGEALVKHVLSEAKKRSIRRVEIGTIAEHTELNDWYRTLGFTFRETKQFPHLPFNVTFMFIEI